MVITEQQFHVRWHCLLTHSIFSDPSYLLNYTLGYYSYLGDMKRSLMCWCAITKLLSHYTL